jgi:Tol biopolymer transport system component
MIRKSCFLLLAGIALLAQGPGPRFRSKVSVYDLRKKSVQVIYTADKLFGAPNWSPDGKYLLLNAEPGLWRLAPAEGAQPEKLDLGPLKGVNNDHGISPDGKQYAISAWVPAERVSHMWLASSDGSNARLMTPKGPSYFHSWSPDGRWLAFTGRRDGNYDIYRVLAAGGEEQRLTSDPGLDDGPDYSPDGKWIYFSSDRSGSGDIWRMPADGAGSGDRKAEQVTKDEYEDWFPHPSPDGKWLVFLSFPKGTKGHNAKQNGVLLRMIPLPGAKLKPVRIQVLVTLFGGQDTINVNSWSPDSKKLAFVSYELLSPPK